MTYVHGTKYAYFTKRCRCTTCRTAYIEQHRTPTIDRALLAELLQELFPAGLTPECPAQQAKRGLAA